MWMYRWVRESLTTTQPPGLRVLTPIFQLLYCRVNPMNLLLFTLSHSSVLLRFNLSLLRTLMFIISPSLHFCVLPLSSPSFLQCISHSHIILLWCVFPPANIQPSLFITVVIVCCRLRPSRIQRLVVSLWLRQALGSSLWYDQTETGRQGKIKMY